MNYQTTEYYIMYQLFVMDHITDYNRLLCACQTTDISALLIITVYKLCSHYYRTYMIHIYNNIEYNNNRVILEPYKKEIAEIL